MTMSETTITCPKCKTVFPLTESLAAPMLAATRKQFEQQLAQRDDDVAKRVVAEEGKKAELASAAELEAKVRELGELHEVLKTRDEKLAEAQKAQAELIKKQRELDDAKRELELTVEKRVQEGLGGCRIKRANQLA